MSERFVILYKEDTFPRWYNKEQHDVSVDASVVEHADVVPLVFNYRHDSIQGRVSEIMVEDGNLTGVVTLSEDSEIQRMLKEGESLREWLTTHNIRLGGWYHDLSERGPVITSATLREVSFIFPSGANPGAHI